MDINILKIMMVGRVNTERRLETLVIDIFSKFLLHVAPEACLIQPHEDERDSFKKSDHFAKISFSCLCSLG